MTKTMNPFVALASFAKAAVDPQVYESDLAGQGVRDIRNIGIAALGAGAAARGIAGLMNMAKRRVNPMKVKRPAAIITHVPVPVDEKLAAEKQSTITDKGAFPWYYPGGLLAAGAGAIGGWKGVDMLLQHRQKAENEEALSGAKTEFEQALLASYSRPRRPSGLPMAASAGEKLGAALDGLFDGMVKKGVNWDNVLGKLKGGYGAYALATGLGVGAMSYANASKGSERSILQKALKQRMQRDYLSRPTEMFTVPREVPVTAREKLAPTPAPPVALPDEDEGVAMANTPSPTAAAGVPRPRRRGGSSILA